MNRVVQVAIGTMIVVAFGGMVADRPNVTQASTPPIEQLTGTTAAINEYRATKKLEPLKLSATLNESAQLKADDIASKHYWSHIAPDGTTPWDYFNKVGYNYSHAGENLAKCYDTGPEVVKAWIESPTHEKVLTGDFTEIGVGTASSDGCMYVVGHFGKQ